MMCNKCFGTGMFDVLSSIPCECIEPCECVDKENISVIEKNECIDYDKDCIDIVNKVHCWMYDTETGLCPFIHNDN